MTTTVRQYGAKIANWSPALGAVLQQNQLRSMYYNALVELDKPIQERKAAFRIAAEETFKEKGLAGLELQSARKAMWAAIKVDPLLEKLYTDRRNGITPARRRFAALGLYSYNYLDVERAYTKAIASQTGAQFKRHDPDSGRICVIYTSGLDTADVYGNSNSAQITPVDPAIYSSRALRRHGMRTPIKLRVGSTSEKKPIWLEFEIYLHREIPTGSIREISLNWQSVAGKRQFNVSVVVNTEEPQAKFPTPPSASIVSVNLGWSERDDGSVRCGYYYGSDGQHGSINLPLRWVNSSNKINELRSIRDLHRNAVQAGLSAWLRSVPDRPAWLDDTTRYLIQWRSAKRLHELERTWRDTRFHADDAGYVMIKEFIKRDLHLGNWEGNLRQQHLLERREIFRTQAAELARKYGELRMEKMDLRTFAERDQLALEALPDARKRRQAVAPSELRQALEMIFKRENRVLKTIVGKTTNTCHHCGATLNVNSRIHQCPACSTQFDIDYNAARVMTDQREPEVQVKTPRRSRRFGKDVVDTKMIESQS